MELGSVRGGSKEGRQSRHREPSCCGRARGRGKGRPRYQAREIVIWIARNEGFAKALEVVGAMAGLGTGELAKDGDRVGAISMENAATGPELAIYSVVSYWISQELNWLESGLKVWPNLIVALTV
jgi:hypothetical protein